jgi:hypothetical protein
MIRALFTVVYRRWLHGDRVLRVTGWRSALVETPHGRRRHMTACFWGLE